MATVLKKKVGVQRNANTHTQNLMSTVTFRAAANKLNIEQANRLLKYFSSHGQWWKVCVSALQPDNMKKEDLLEDTEFKYS